MMKVRVIEGNENDYEMIEIEASSSDEADLIGRLWNDGVRVVSGNRWKIVICSPKLAGLTAYYLNDFQENFIHKALVDAYVEDRTLSDFLKKLAHSSEL